MTSETPAGPEETKPAPPARRFPRSRLSASERGRMLRAVREVDFPMGLRGYDRVAVDRYVQQVNRLIAELELSSSPESAVRHALEEVSEETSGLLQRAYDTAEEITARSRAKADDRLEQAEREAAELREAADREAHEARETAQRDAQELRATATREARELVESAAREAQEVRAKAHREVEEMRAAAETRVGQLERHYDTVSRERRRLIEDMKSIAQQQLEIADGAAARFPRGDTAEGSAPARDPAADGLVEAEEPTVALPEGPGR